MASTSHAQVNGYVQGLNNFYQRTRGTQNEISYTVTGPAPGDKYTATVTLRNTGKSYTGIAVGVKSAKEAAAQKAMQALGQAK